MKKILFLIIAVVSLSGTVLAQDTNKQRVVEVNATAEKAVTPDEIFLNITINEKDNKGKISIDIQEKQMIKALEELGIDIKEQLTIKNMGSSLKTYTLKKDEIYVAKDYSLKLSSAATAYAVIDALKSIGIADIILAKCSLSHELEIKIKDGLLEEATKKAQENAKIMAKAVGSNLGKALFLSNSYNFDSFNIDSLILEEEAIPVAKFTKSASAPEIRISKKYVSMQVRCKFELLD